MWSQTGNHQLRVDEDTCQYQGNVLYQDCVVGIHPAEHLRRRASDVFWLDEKVFLLRRSEMGES